MSKIIKKIDKEEKEIAYLLGIIVVAEIYDGNITSTIAIGPDGDCIFIKNDPINKYNSGKFKVPHDFPSNYLNSLIKKLIKNE